MKFRKKPVVVDAWQWTGTTLRDAMNFCHQNNLPKFVPGTRSDKNGLVITGLIIYTLEGDHLAEKGDWIIREIKGEYSPCKPDIFKKTYELVSEDNKK